MSALFTRTLSSVQSAADAVAFVADPRNRGELDAVGCLFGNDDAFQNAVVRMLENPYNPARGGFSTYWYDNCKAARTKTGRQARPNGVPQNRGSISKDSVACRGNSGSSDDAGSRLIADGTDNRSPEVGGLEVLVAGFTPGEERVARAIATTGSVKGAAEMLGISVPSVCQSIRSFRDKLAANL